jgi:hypothetical protein
MTLAKACAKGITLAKACAKDITPAQDNPSKYLRSHRNLPRGSYTYNTYRQDL